MHERRFNRAIKRLRDPDRVERLEVSRVVKLVLEGATFSSVLDVGTGSALFAEAFAAQGMKVAGVDANPEMLPVAFQYVPTGDFKEGIAEDLPFDDASFDLVFMGLVFHETDEPEKAMREAFRVAKERLAVLEWPYREQEFGPGIAERIPAQKMQEYAEKVGFKLKAAVELNNLVLYLFDK